MKISLTKKVIAGAGAVTLAALGVLAGVRGAAPASADTVTVTWLRNGGQYGDGRENLCLDVVDTDLSLTTRPCTGARTTQSWKITTVSSTTAWIENTQYRKCIGVVGASKKPVLMDCGFPNAKGFFTTKQYDPSWLSIHKPDTFDERRSWLATAYTPSVTLQSEYYAGPTYGANGLSRWQQLGQLVYYPPPKNPCSGIRCEDPM
ncbi:hypothetical protein ACFTSF_18885 [Kribbella sp. NPDC056951]|uniref:hypothetical protein n=1 Tax=Kribbella sp. NPDC056951 TaxID=3345978 RepID=UPI0036255007